MPAGVHVCLVVCRDPRRVGGLGARAWVELRRGAVRQHGGMALEVGQPDDEDMDLYLELAELLEQMEGGIRALA